MGRHLELSAAAPGWKLVRLLHCWRLYDRENEYCGDFRTRDAAIAAAVRLSEKEAR